MVNEIFVPYDLGKLQERRRRSAEFFSTYTTPETPSKRPLSTTINRPIEHVSTVLSNIENLSMFMENLEEIESLVDGRHTWRFRSSEDRDVDLKIPMRSSIGNAKDSFTWEAEDGAGFKYSIAIMLEPAQADRGTVARMMVMYDSVMGDFVGIFEKMFGKDADVLSKKNLQRLKAFCETGNVPTTVGQPSGRDEDQPESMKH